MPISESGNLGNRKVISGVLDMPTEATGISRQGRSISYICLILYDIERP